MEALPYDLAHKTVKRYACSNCWGDLEIGPSDLVRPGHVFVICAKCGDDTRGYVTQYFVERRRSESHFQLGDVNRLLRSLKLIPEREHIPLKPGETEVQRLNRELGFE